MNYIASTERKNYQTEDVDVASLQIAFGQAMILMHKETHPTLDGMAEIWISKSAFMVHHARIAGHKALVNFLICKPSYASRREQKILDNEIQRLEENIRALESIPCPQGYYLWRMNKLIKSRSSSGILPVRISAAKPNSHCVTRGANRNFARIKMACKSGLAGVKKWLKKN